MTDTTNDRGFDDIDNEDGVCTCGEVHEGLGAEWFHVVATYGVEDPRVRSMIAQALIDKGVLTLEELSDPETAPSYPADTLRSMALELAFPEANHRYFDWAGQPEAMGASAYMTQVLLEKLRDVAATVLAIGLGGYAIHPQHLSQIEETVDQVLKPLGTYVLQTNVLHPESNTDLHGQGESGIPAPASAVVDATDVHSDKPWAAKFRLEVQDRLQGLIAVEQKFRSLVEGGIDPAEASAIVSSEMVQALGWAEEAEAVGVNL